MSPPVYMSNKNITHVTKLVYTNFLSVYYELYMNTSQLTLLHQYTITNILSLIFLQF